MGTVVRLWDGLVNALTGAGSTVDPRSYNSYAARILTDQQIDAAYRGGWLMRRIVDKPATEMVREWRDWQAESDAIGKLEAAEKALDLRNKVRRAETLRGLGGAGLVLWVPGDQSQPLLPENIRLGQLQAVHVWHRSRFTLGPLIETWGDPWFGHPAFYEVRLGGANVLRFHPSRVVAFKGDPLPDIASAAPKDWFWGESKVATVLDAVQNVDMSQNGFAALIKDARNRRIGVPRLLEKVSTAGGEAQMAKRMQAFAMGESLFGVSFYDSGDGEGKGGESIDDRQMVWAGIPDIAAMYLQAAAAAADMPATVLLGKSPDGMNATGDSDLAIWEKTVSARQELDLRPCLAQVDAALIPSALGKVDDSIWYEFAPLSTLSEKDEATTFYTFMQGVEKLQATASIPAEAFDRALQNTLEERGWLPGLGDALAMIPEDERFGISAADPANDDDPSALQEGGDPASAGTGGDGSVARRRAANDARFRDAAPKTLYVQRKLLNTAEFIRWAKGQGFDTTTPADEMHVTIAYSRTPLDWMKIGQDWSSDAAGNLTVPAGGPRIVQALGDKGAVVLLFGSSDLSWRHDAIREAGASFDFDQYQPHVTITYQAPDGLDLSKVQPYVGPLKFGPELFSEIDEDWSSGITEE